MSCGAPTPEVATPELAAVAPIAGAAAGAAGPEGGPMKEYEIDPVSAASPEMNEGQYLDLRASIQEIGQLVPIVVADGKIIDGRKRYRACRELGKEPFIIEVPLGTDPATQALALNLLRTHYTASQRSIYAAAVASRDRGRNWESNSPTSVNNTPTIKQAARAHGISQSMVIDAKKVRRDAIPTVVAAVERGDLTVHGAVQVARAPREEQPARLDAVLTKPKGRDGRRISPGPIKRRTAKAPDEQFDRVVQGLAFGSDALSEIAGRLGHQSQARYQSWMSSLRATRTAVSRVIKLLEEIG